MEFTDRHGPFSLSRLIAEAKRRARRRRFVLAALAVAIATTAVAGGIFFESSNGQPAVHGAGAAPILQGTGVICAGRSGMWFSSPDPVGGPPPTVCDGEIRVQGFDVARLDKAVAVGHGVTLGSAFVKGVFRGGVLHVIGQGRPRRGRTGVVLADLPCQQPAGGWPTVPLGYRPFEAALQSNPFPSDLTATRLFRSRGVTVLAVGSTHPARTRRVLGAQLPERLCVMRSRYGSEVIQKTRAQLEGNMHRYGIYTFYPGLSDRGQPIFEAHTLLVTPQLRAWLRTMPAGLVQIVPDLRQVGL